MKNFQVKNKTTGKISIMPEAVFNEVKKNDLSKDEKGKLILEKLKEVDENGMELNSKESNDFKKMIADEKTEKEKLKK